MSPPLQAALRVCDYWSRFDHAKFWIGKLKLGNVGKEDSYVPRKIRHKKPLWLPEGYYTTSSRILEYNLMQVLIYNFGSTLS